MSRRWIRLWVGLILIQFLVSERTLRSSPTMHRMDDPVDLVVVVNGGWSCDIALSFPKVASIGIRGALREMIRERFPETLRVHEILSCFGDRTEDHVNYFLPSTGDQKHFASFDRYLADVQQEVGRFVGSRLVIIGHSYGGWLSIKTAAAIAESRQRTIDGLVTIDPISPVLCHFFPLQNNLGPIFEELKYRSMEQILTPCTGIPRDVSLHERQTIAGVAAFWDNFYQNNTGIIRGDPYPEAGRNTHIPVPWYLLHAHSEIDTHPLVWKSIGERLIELYPQPGASFLASSDGY